MINLRPSDLCIKTLDDGREVIQLRGAVAFNEQFIEEMKQEGVAPIIERQEEVDESE